MFPTYYVYAGEAYTGSNQSEAGVAWLDLIPIKMVEMIE